MRYKMTIEYFGREFHGWQKHKNFTSVQEKLESAIEKFSKCNVTVFGSGRTDSGVHALGQVAHFDLENPKLTPYSMMHAINHHLRPSKITVLNLEETDQEFHARFSAKARHYEYKIINRSAPLTIEAHRAWLVRRPLNIAQMKIHAIPLIGRNDLSSFRDSRCQAKTALRNISSIDITQDGELIRIKISAPSFLHRQVRIIVGTLVECNLNGSPDDYISHIIQCKNRSCAGVTAPPDGLYLSKIEF